MQTIDIRLIEFIINVAFLSIVTIYWSRSDAFNKFIKLVNGIGFLIGAIAIAKHFTGHDYANYMISERMIMGYSALIGGFFMFAKSDGHIFSRIFQIFSIISVVSTIFYFFA